LSILYTLPHCSEETEEHLPIFAGDVRFADTQEQARQKARELAIKEKVEVLIHRVDNKIRARDSYGNDPHPPKG
jgi:hypothetical protein